MGILAPRPLNHCSCGAPAATPSFKSYIRLLLGELVIIKDCLVQALEASRLVEGGTTLGRVPVSLALG